MVELVLILLAKDFIQQDLLCASGVSNEANVVNASTTDYASMDVLAVSLLVLVIAILK
jgi:hypothetical protein